MHQQDKRISRIGASAGSAIIVFDTLESYLFSKIWHMLGLLVISSKVFQEVLADLNSHFSSGTHYHRRPHFLIIIIIIVVVIFSRQISLSLEGNEGKFAPLPLLMIICWSDDSIQRMPQRSSTLVSQKFRLPANDDMAAS